MTKLDRIDAAILEVVQKNNRLTSDELSAMVNLSPSACQRRLKRLRSDGIINKDVSILSPRLLGRMITMIVLVSLERERVQIVDRFKRAIRENPDVIMGYYITGEADFLLIVSAKDIADYEQFTRRFFNENSDIKGFKSMVVLEPIKIGFELPIDADDAFFSS